MENLVLELKPTDPITFEMLKSQDACAEALRWVKSNIPDGTPYDQFLQALEKAEQIDWRDWLISIFGASILAANWNIQAILDATKDVPESSSGDYAQIGSSGHYAKIGSSGDSAQIGSSGDSAKIGSSGHSAHIGSSGHSAQIGSSGHYAKIGSSGHSAKIGSSGDSAKIGSSGHYAKIGSSGDYAKIGSSGHSAKIGSSGHYAKIELTGKNSICAAVASNSTARATEGGCIALGWVDREGRPRLAVGYVGENIKADTWYGVNAKGVLTEIE